MASAMSHVIQVYVIMIYLLFTLFQEDDNDEHTGLSDLLVSKFFFLMIQKSVIAFSVGYIF